GILAEPLGHESARNGGARRPPRDRHLRLAVAEEHLHRRLSRNLRGRRGRARGRRRIFGQGTRNGGDRGLLLGSAAGGKERKQSGAEHDQDRAVLVAFRTKHPSYSLSPSVALQRRQRRLVGVTARREITLRNGHGVAVP